MVARALGADRAPAFTGIIARVSEKPSKARTFQAPKGTRDFYPREMLVRRYITDAWRRVSLRHGFEEIDGPTFEFLDLYKVKSGEGIVSELFSFRREGGEDDYALRPEFTPTLARMYATRARQLPQPTKWFCVSNFFRAERPQRGRLREFWQWNVDFLGPTFESDISITENAALGDAETVFVAMDAMRGYGLSPENVRAKVSDRRCLASWCHFRGVPESQVPAVMALLDKRGRLSQQDFVASAIGLGVDKEEAIGFYVVKGARTPLTAEWINGHLDSPLALSEGIEVLLPLSRALEQLGQVNSDHPHSWCEYDSSIVRGLAYYTGMVFEVIAEGERAVAGGGRYDNLIELFGGPPTPACGFGMGDAVLGNLLEDRGLIPEGRDMLEALAQTMPFRPDAFVVASESEAAQNAVVPLVAKLRRGEESAAYRDSQASSDAAKRMKPWDARRYDIEPLHARRSYKATKNIGKLLADASACHARFAVIIEQSGEVATVKDLDVRDEKKDVPLDKVASMVGRAART